MKRPEREHKAAAPYRRLTGVEAFLLGMDRGPVYNHTLKVAILDPSIDPDGWSFERYRALCERQLSRGSLLVQRYLPTPLGLHQPIWVDDPDFDLDTHLRRVGCPAPGGMAELCALIEQIYPHPLDHSRPLWQVWVVEGLEGGQVALVGLVHHAYTDGAGARGIIEDMTSSTPTDIAVGESPVWDLAPLPSKLRRVVWAVRDLPPVLRAVPSAMTAMRERRRLERAFAANDASARPTAQDRRRPQPFSGPLARSRRFACKSFSLEQMRDVRESLGGTVNDVFLCCAAGSVREFLGRRGSPPPGPVIGTIGMLSKPLTERQGQGGNFSTGHDVWLHVEIADPIERMAATRASAQATKDHFKAVAAADPFLVLFDLMPGWPMKALLRFDERTEGRATPTYNMAVSNVPGPTETLYFGPWRVERLFSTGQLLHGLTVNFTAWSYNGQFNLSVLTGSSEVPDAWELVNGFQSALDELHTLAGAAPPQQFAAAAEGVE